MSAWSTQTDTVGSVLTNVPGHLGDEEGTEGLSGSISDRHRRSGRRHRVCRQHAVSTALGVFVEHFSPICGQMVKRTSSALSGWAEATEQPHRGRLPAAPSPQRTEARVAEGTVPNGPPLEENWIEDDIEEAIQKDLDDIHAERIEKE